MNKKKDFAVFQGIVLEAKNAVGSDLSLTVAVYSCVVNNLPSRFVWHNLQNPPTIKFWMVGKDRSVIWSKMLKPGMAVSVFVNKVQGGFVVTKFTCAPPQVYNYDAFIKSYFANL